jgi:TrmH RNA methyltransferase
MQKDDHHREAKPQQSRGRREEELRVYGVNACLAAYAHRPQDLRKVWLTEANIPAFKQVLAWCVKQRIGYRVVEADEIERLTASSHHEGVCFALLRTKAPSLDDVLKHIDPDMPALLMWLHGVGNPHNLGAILRSAAHFGVGAVLLSDAQGLSPAAYRVSEGGAEAVPCVHAGDIAATLAQLRRAGFRLAATTVRGGESLYAAPLPSRVALLLGAESTGLPQRVLDGADLRLRIPGTGAVESLNVSVASALLIAEWARVHKVGA